MHINRNKINLYFKITILFFMKTDQRIKFVFIMSNFYILFCKLKFSLCVFIASIY